MNRMLIVVLLWWGGSLVAVPPWIDAVEELGLVELGDTFDHAKIDRLLGAETMSDASEDHRRAVAVLVAIGAVDVSALSDAVRAEAQLARYQRSLSAPEECVVVSLDDISAFMRLEALEGHEALRQDPALMASLDAAIGEGVLTGYGLRPLRVSAASDPMRTLIYSHSSLPHVKQLVGLVASEGLRGRVYLAPKIAAFVFREGWGERPEWINELGPDVYVAQGPEMLVHFEFEQSGDRQHFDAIVERFAKKDSEDETGNLIRSWWQPFYYAETAAEGFYEISRVTLYGDTAEASLLMLSDRTKLVQSHFAGTSWQSETDSIWVNAPFYRFLQGDFK